MGWPQSQDYNEAIQNARTCFKDAELSKGAAVTNPLGMPLPCSGNFADVYQVHCPETKTRWAVKCFTRGDPKALEDRYAKIDQHLQQAKLPFAVGFRYLVEGIRVRGQWHPVLKMQWVEGFTLNHFVRDNLDKPNVLDALLQIWVRMGKRLREADMAHADLQHGNVMLVAGSTSASLAVKLIDYDGMWVPALEGKKSGEVGHPAYQHTKRLYEGTYSKEVDRFPLLVVATALRCLRVAGRPLWEKFDNGDNLLFREADLAAPERSPLFAELTKIPDAQAQKLVDTLLKATTEPLEDTPPVDLLLGESTKKQVAVTKPGPAAPMPEAAFADLGDPEAPGSTSALHRRRDAAAPAWKKWAMIGGGAGAALLATILILALSRGTKDAPAIPADNQQAAVENRQPDKPAQTTPPTPPAPSPLTIAALPETRIDLGASRRFVVNVAGAEGDAAFRVELQDLPEGVRAERRSLDARAGNSEWELFVAAAAPTGLKEVTVAAFSGRRATTTTFRLSIPMSTVARPPDPPVPPPMPPPTPRVVRKGDSRLEQNRTYLSTLAFSADGSRLYGADSEGVTVWDCATGKRTAELARGGRGFVSGGVRHDGAALFGGHDSNIYFRPANSDRPRIVGAQGTELFAVVLSSDGKRGASIGAATAVKDGVRKYDTSVLKIWDVENDKQLHSLPMSDSGPWRPLAISGDGRRVLVSGPSAVNQPRHYIVDTTTGRLHTSRAVRPGATADTVVLSADGKLAGMMMDSRVHVLDIDADKILLRTDVIREPIYCLAFSPDARFVISCGGNHAPDTGVAQLWQIATGKEVMRKDLPDKSIRAVAFSADGRWVAAAVGGQVPHLWDLEGLGKPEPPVVVERAKRPPPAQPDQEASLANVKRVFAAEYAKAKPTDRLARTALADQLLARAREINDNPTDRFVLIREAADLYQQLGASGPLLGAIDLLAEDFAVDRVALKEQALHDLAKATTQPTARKPLAEACLNALEDARLAENFDALTRLAKLAEELAVGSGDPATRTRVTSIVKDVRDLVKESEDALKAEATLKSQPDDAAANLLRGKFLCFRIGAWQRGLPLLARGDDAKLKELASGDLANPAGADEQAKLADGWFDVSKGLTAGKGEVLRRAAHWYSLALAAGLTALNKERVEKQLKAIEPQLPPTRALPASGERLKIEARGAVARVAYLPDGGRLVTCGNDLGLQVWDLRSGKDVKTLRPPAGRGVVNLIVGDDGWIGTSEGRTLRWTDATEKRNSYGSGFAREVLSLAYVGKSKRAVVGFSEGRLTVVEEGGGETRSLDLKNPAGGFTAVAGSAVGGGLVLAGSESGTLLLYSLQAATRQTPLRLGTHAKPIVAVALTADGTRAVSVGEDKTIRVWDVKLGREARRLVGHSGAVTDLALSPDGRRVATCGEDGTVRVWDLTTYQELRRFVGHKGKVNAVAFSPDGRRLASAGDDGTIRLWGM